MLLLRFEYQEPRSSIQEMGITSFLKRDFEEIEWFNHLAQK